MLIILYIDILSEYIDRQLIQTHKAVDYLLQLGDELGIQFIREKDLPLVRFAHNSPSHASGLQDKAAPKLQDATDAPAYRATQKAPTPAPASETPPRRGTQTPLLLYQHPSQ